MKNRNIIMFALLLGMSNMKADEVVVNNITIPQGGEAALNIKLNNTSEYTRFSIDMVLPEGITITGKKLGERFATTDHTVRFGTWPNWYRFIGDTEESMIIPGTSGTLITVSLKADESLSVGSTFQGILTGFNQGNGEEIGMEFTTPTDDPVLLSRVTFTITIAENDRLDEVTLSDGKDYSNSSDVEVGTLHYSRTYTNTYWQAWYAPFDLTLTSEVMEHFAFAKFAGTYTEEDGSFYITVVRMKEGDVVKANTPYCVQAKIADSTNPQIITQTDAILKAPELNSFYVLSAEKKITFWGNYVQRKVTGDDQNMYGLSGGKYSKLVPGNTLKSFRCFFTIEDREDNPYASIANPSEVKLMELGDDVETSIQGMKDEEDSNVYDLSGRMMNRQRMSNGIYIINNKKFFVK